MKKIISICFACLMAITVRAQAPQKMSYQGVIRNAANNLVVNTNVSMRISILQGSSSGSPVYVELQSGTTNINGLLTVQVGDGNVQSGSFSGINWAAGPYFIKTETDPTGGTNYSIIGNTELLSVPYALYSQTSGSGGGGGNWLQVGNDITNANSGRVGVGTQSPQQNLSVYQGLNIDQEGTGNGSLNTNSLSFGSGSGEGIASDRILSSNNGFGLDFSTSFTKRMSITNTGRVGIGTEQPGSLLHLFGDGSGGAPQGDLVMSRVWNNPFDTRASAVFHYFDPNTNLDNLAFGVSGDGGSWDAPNFFSQTKMLIQSNGKVGIGTTTPEARLDVKDAVQITGYGVTSSLNLVPFSTPGFDPGARIQAVDDGGFGAHLDFFTKPFGVASNPVTNRMRITNNGNVGIGTLIPSQKLEIDTINTTAFNAIRLNTTYDLLQSGTNSLGFEIRVQDGGFSSYRMYPTGSYLRFAESSDGFASATDIIRFDPFSFEPVPDNVILLGSAQHRWTEVWAANGVIQTSDSRHKQSVTDIQYGLSEVMKLKPVSYQWKNEKLKCGTGTNLGFIAQDLETIIPDVVVHTVNSNDKETGAAPVEAESFGVKYAELIPVLTKAIQEQQVIIQDQETRIQRLEKLISELEKK